MTPPRSELALPSEPVRRSGTEPVELAPTETAGQSVALSAMSRPRQALLRHLKAAGEATADQLAEQLGLSVGAVRQLIGPLAGDGLLAHRDERNRPGRPRRWYCLTPAAETLFPKRYGQLANQLLGLIGSDLVDQAFDERARQRQARAEARLAGLDLPAKVAELARILDEDGYLAECERVGPGRWRISELNCAILDVARHHGAACGTELAFIRAVLPDAHVERVSHILSGGHSCSYDVTAR